MVIEDETTPEHRRENLLPNNPVAEDGAVRRRDRDASDSRRCARSWQRVWKEVMERWRVQKERR